MANTAVTDNARLLRFSFPEFSKGNLQILSPEDILDVEWNYESPMETLISPKPVG